MIIDKNARAKLFQRQQNEKVVQAIQTNQPKPQDNSKVENSLKNVEDLSNSHLALNAVVYETLSKIEQDLFEVMSIITKQSESLPERLQSLRDTNLNPDQVNQIIEAFSNIKIPQPLSEISVPEIQNIIKELQTLKKELQTLKPIDKPLQKIEGTVEIANFPKTQKSEPIDLKPLLTAIQKIKLQTPDTIKVANSIAIENWQELLDGIEELKKGFNLLINREGGNLDGPMEVAITNFPPQMVPQPVTKIDINPLRGEFTSHSVTVGTSITPLPSTPLSKRRSLILFNNHASATLYIGGSNVTASGTTTGLPVLAQSYSPAFDADARMILYGISAASSIEVIVLESSNDYGTTSTSLGNI